MSEFLEILSEGALEELKQVQTLVKSLANDIKSINNFKTSSTPSGADKNIKSISDAYEQQSKSIEKVRLGLEKTSAIQSQVEQTAKNQNKATQNLTKEELSYANAIERGMRAKERAAKAQTELSRAYVQLVSKQQQAKKTLQDLIVTQGTSSIATKKAQREYNVLTARINQANKATSNFSKTGLGGLVRGFRNLLGAFGILGGVQLFASMAKSVFDITKKLQSLDYALKAVATDTYEFARTQEFLKDITNRYGADIVTTTERYTKFLAAAKQSNVALKDTEQIFDTVTKAAGVLGLKTDELSGIYLALEQMLSKGKVTTEELRRQLGERLPGAFGIMAQALNVTTAELDKMLRKGEIISSETLPKFAKQLEKAYGIQSVTKINTLVAAQTRLNNSWTEFVRSLSGEGGGQGIITLFNVISDRLLLVSESITKFQKSLAFLSTGFRVFKETVKPVTDVVKELFESFKSLTGIDLAKYTKNTLSFIKALTNPSLFLVADAIKMITRNFVGLGAVMTQFYENLSNVNIGLDPIKNAKELAKAFEGLGDAYKKGFWSVDMKIKQEEEKMAFAERNALIIRTSALMTELAFAQKKNLTAEEAQAELTKLTTEEIRDKEIALKKMLEALKNLNDEEGDGVSRPKNQTSVISIESQGEQGVSGGIIRIKQAIDLQIESIKELLEYTPKWSSEYDVLTKHLESLEKAFDGIDVTKAMSEIDKWSEGVKKSEDKTREAYLALKEFREGFQTEFFSDLGFDFTGEVLMNFDKISKMLEEGGDKWEDYFLLITEMAQEAFNFINQASQQNFDAEYERLEKQKEVSLMFAGESDAAKKRIDEQYEARRKAIQTREAKAQKQLAIFNTTINTAQAVVAALAIGPPQGIVFAAIVGALGIAQIAMIASQKVPEFWKGTENAPAGLAWTQEKGAEIIADKKGNIKDFGDNKGARLTMMEKGDKVITAEKTKQMLFNKDLNNILTSNNISPTTIEVKSSGASANEIDSIMGKYFSNIQTNQTIIDKKGLNTYVKKQNSKTSSLNNRVEFKGYSV